MSTAIKMEVTPELPQTPPIEENGQQHDANNNTRLPGLMAHSQPNTPRPEQDESRRSFSVSQPIRHVVRGRASVFAAETGPYFSSTRSFENLFGSNKQDLLTPMIQARMDRGFFMADTEWTCYRRNYFQVSGVFSVHGFNHYIQENDPHVYVKSNDVYHPVQRFLLGVSAGVANGDREIELIQHTAKRDKGPQFKPAPKPVSHGGNLNISNSMGNGGIAVFERLQFKTATANNGKRRAAQQYYVCYVNLYAETDRFELIQVATCQSAPLVVRGRSPGHYADSSKIRQLKNTAAPYPTPTTEQPQLQQYNNENYQKPMPQQQQEMVPYYYTPQYSSPLPPVYNHYEEYDQSNAPTPKLQPYIPPNMNEYHEWQRSRYNSASSGSSSVPSPQPHEQPHYFAQHDQRSYSPTTPTYVPMVAQQPKFPSLLK